MKDIKNTDDLTLMKVAHLLVALVVGLMTCLLYKLGKRA